MQTNKKQTRVTCLNSKELWLLIRPKFRRAKKKQNKKHVLRIRSTVYNDYKVLKVDLKKLKKALIKKY